MKELNNNSDWIPHICVSYPKFSVNAQNFTAIFVHFCCRSLCGERGLKFFRNIAQQKNPGRSLCGEMELPYFTEEQYDDFLGYLKTLI